MNICLYRPHLGSCPSQAYFEAYVRSAMALISRPGIFIRPLGYETVPAPDNFFYTRGYILNSGERFTHVELLLI